MCRSSARLHAARAQFITPRRGRAPHVLCSGCRVVYAVGLLRTQSYQHILLVLITSNICLNPIHARREEIVHCSRDSRDQRLVVKASCTTNYFTMWYHYLTEN